MACQACIDRARRLVRWLCKKSEGRLCVKARAKLARMLGESDGQ